MFIPLYRRAAEWLGSLMRSWNVAEPSELTFEGAEPHIDQLERELDQEDDILLRGIAPGEPDAGPDTIYPTNEKGPQDESCEP